MALQMLGFLEGTRRPYKGSLLCPSSENLLGRESSPHMHTGLLLFHWNQSFGCFLVPEEGVCVWNATVEWQKLWLSKPGNWTSYQACPEFFDWCQVTGSVLIKEQSTDQEKNHVHQSFPIQSEDWLESLFYLTWDKGSIKPRYFVGKNSVFMISLNRKRG